MEQCIFFFLDPFSFQFQHLSEFGKNRCLQGGLEGTSRETLRSRFLSCLYFGEESGASSLNFS